MGQIFSLVVAIAAVVFFGWLMLGAVRPSNENAEIDPSDARQLGTLGMTGGSIASAAVAQFALRRFEEQHGRKATVKDMGIVAGMMRGGQ